MTLLNKRLWNTIGNWRWWVVLPLVLPILIIALIVDLFRMLGNWINVNHSSITNVILWPMVWARKGWKYP